ncbi:MAG: aminotransferase class I/II-fold pyridoxal phosphate-dependent enzyme [Pseudomonadota bacterium]
MTQPVSLDPRPATRPAAALSQQAAQLLGEGGDDGWGIFYRARALREAGHEVVNLAVGEHDRPTDPTIVEVLRKAAAEGPHGYAPVTGGPALRAAVAARLARHGAAEGPAEVLFTAGCQMALLIACHLALDPGDECVIVDPYYATYPQTVRAAGGVPVPVIADVAAGFQPDIDAIGRAIGPRTRAIFINTPNNPSGAVYAPERLEALAALCRRHDLWLISDEVYQGLVHRGTHLSPRALPGMAGRTLVAGSLSKTFAMTGWRAGWLAGPEAVMGRAGDYAVAATYGVPPFIQAAALYALTEGAAIEAAIAAETKARAEAVLAAITPGGPVSAAPPDGAMYAMLDISRAGLPGPVFAERLLERALVATMPGESFGAAGTGFLRLALVASEAKLTATVQAIETLVTEGATAA